MPKLCFHIFPRESKHVLCARFVPKTVNMEISSKVNFANIAYFVFLRQGEILCECAWSRTSHKHTGDLGVVSIFALAHAMPPKSLPSLLLSYLSPNKCKSN